MINKYIIEPLDRKLHDRVAFDCGIAELNSYIKQQARQDQQRGATVVFILREFQSRTIIGYYTLSAISVEPTNLPDDVLHKLPRYPTLPAALVGRLALDSKYQGQGIGGYLLVSALKHALRLSKTEIGITCVIVDAKDDKAQRFYESYGFLQLTTQERRLILPMKTIVDAFDE